MKKISPPRKSLVLKTQIVRALQNGQLGQVAGGVPCPFYCSDECQKQAPAP